MSIKEKNKKKSLDSMVNKDALRKVINQSFAYQNKMDTEHQRRTSENMMEWNKKHLSPSGGKKAFVRTQPTQPKPKRFSKWLTKSDDE